MRKGRFVALLVVLLVPVMAVGIAQASSRLKSKVTVHTSPKHITGAPFTWHQTGTIVLPSKFCPHGANNPPYCEKTPKSFCNGTVTVNVSLAKNANLAKSGKKVAIKKAKVKNCRYALTIKLNTSIFTAKQHVPHPGWVGVRFSDHFGGNSHATADTARTRTVLAKVQP